MFELPEMTVLAHQMNSALWGKMISLGRLGNSPHKFVWYNRGAEEFTELTRGKTIRQAQAQGRWLLVDVEPGFRLVFGECGGKILLQPAGEKLPKKYHLHLAFTDGTSLTATTQMWGAYELYITGEEQQREYMRGMRPTPRDPEFTPGYFEALLEELLDGPKRTVKSLLTQDQLIPGLGNAIAQDIMFAARLHPRHALEELNTAQRAELYSAIVSTVDQVIAGGGRYDEYDLFGCPGGYVRVMDQHALERPCPGCGGEVVKIQYLGGACYLCPTCQPI